MKGELRGSAIDLRDKRRLARRGFVSLFPYLSSCYNPGLPIPEIYIFVSKSSTMPLAPATRRTLVSEQSVRLHELQRIASSYAPDTVQHRTLRDMSRHFTDMCCKPSMLFSFSWQSADSQPVCPTHQPRQERQCGRK